MGARKSGRRRGGDRQGSSADGTGEAPGRQGRGQRHTPEARRAAVEALHESGLTQQAFARQWDVSHVTLGAWRREGKSLRAIAAALDEEGHQLRGRRWHTPTIARVIAAASS